MSTRSVVEEELFANGLYSAILDDVFDRCETDGNNSPQALWVCCSRNRSVYWGIDDSELLIDWPQYPLPAFHSLAF